MLSAGRHRPSRQVRDLAMTLAEQALGAIASSPMTLDGLDRHIDPHPVRRKDPEQARRAISSPAIQAAGAAAVDRTITGAMMFPADMVCSLQRRGGWIR